MPAAAEGEDKRRARGIPYGGFHRFSSFSFILARYAVMLLRYMPLLSRRRQIYFPLREAAGEPACHKAAEREEQPIFWLDI